MGIGTSTFGARTPEEIAARRDVLKYLPGPGCKVVGIDWRPQAAPAAVVTKT